MGRMLESLKPNGTPAVGRDADPAQHEAGLASCPTPDEEAVEALPFIEVGGPRPPAPPRLQTPAPRSAALEQRLPLGVTLQPAAVRPTAKVAAELITWHQPEHEASRQYATLFAQIMPEPGVDPAPVLLLTGLTPGAGTTTTLLNLAISGCRQHQRRIVVVDAQRVRPAAAQRLGLANSAGLAEVLQGKIALEQALQTTIQPELFILPAGAQEPHATWSAEAVRWVLAWLRQRFDLVVVDAPPWQTAELATLLPAVDTVYLVLDKSEQAQAQVRAVTRGIAQRGGRLGGLIVTQ
jgi:succinoglycan biosynthesis transport protein ExoP